MIVSTKNSQSILDIAIEHTGTIESFIHVMVNNSISDLQFAGGLDLTGITTQNKRVISFFQSNPSPASGIDIVQSTGAFNQSFNQSFN